MRFTNTLCGLVFVLILSAPPRIAAQETSGERWLYNVRERTEHALEAHSAGKNEAAAEAFARAERLSEQPTTLYNGATARLAAARLDTERETAVRLLEQAIAADPTLADAFYNLGTARLAGDDARGAIEAFQSALRVDPGHHDAKFNLEWALRQVEEEEEEEESGEDDSEEEQEEEQQSEQEQQQDQQEQQQEQQSDPNAPPEEQEQQSEQEQQQQNSALPQFQNLPDMTAEEAAEILEAVENLEREERRQQAMNAAKTSTRELKDW